MTNISIYAGCSDSTEIKSNNMNENNKTLESSNNLNKNISDIIVTDMDGNKVKLSDSKCCI